MPSDGSAVRVSVSVVPVVPMVALVVMLFLLLDLLVSFTGRTGPSLCLSECRQAGPVSFLVCMVCSF